MNGIAESLLELLPHRPPMTMLSDVVSVDGQGSAVAVADVSEDSIFHDSALGGTPACAAIEYMAQTVALIVGDRHRRNGETPKVGFLLGTRKLDVSIPSFKSGTRYEVTANCIYSDDEFASFDCTITDPDGATVASATLTAFQPPGDPEEFAEKMKERG